MSKPSGLYIHIPFCKSRCLYCDFYSTTLGNRVADRYVDAVLREAEQRRQEMDADGPVTVYIGGGTPSQLPVQSLRRLVDGLQRVWSFDQVIEFTLEANPEDVTTDYVMALPKIINRVSMGVQSFIDAELRTLRRRHDSKRPAEAVKILRQAGIDNISIDLMYGLPSQTLESFEQSIDTALSLDIQHISAYNLQVEEGTPLAHMVESGELKVADDELCVAMNRLLRSKLLKVGFEHYEISNYARSGYRSRHNSSYWVCAPYVGLGPGAHSYDGQYSRSWNEPSLEDYLAGNINRNGEVLTASDLYNERVMLGLRTSDGIELALAEEQPTVLASLLERRLLTVKDNRVRLSPEGLAFADEVMREFFKV